MTIDKRVALGITFKTGDRAYLETDGSVTSWGIGPFIGYVRGPGMLRGTVEVMVQPMVQPPPWWQETSAVDELADLVREKAVPNL